MVNSTVMAPSPSTSQVDDLVPAIFSKPLLFNLSSNAFNISEDMQENDKSRVRKPPSPKAGEASPQQAAVLLY
jgi:hypothetical protein